MKKKRVNNSKIDNPRQLPGFIKKSFPMFYGGGEIWFEHLDGIYEYEELVLEKLDADYKEFTRPSMPSLICFNIDETSVTDEIIEQITKMLTDGSKVYLKICFVGVDRKAEKKLKNNLSGKGFIVGFIDDFENAKKWLMK